MRILWLTIPKSIGMYIGGGISCVHLAGLTIFRPLINRKLEEKDCGEGPNLENIFEDDIHMNDIQERIIVSTCTVLYVGLYY